MYGRRCEECNVVCRFAENVIRIRINKDFKSKCDLRKIGALAGI